MFEQSMLVSQARGAEPGERWTWAGSIALQSCAALLLIASPLLHPERMVVTLPAQRPPLPIKIVTLPEVKVERAHATTAPSAVAVTFANEARPSSGPPRIPHTMPQGEPLPISLTGFGQGSGTGLPSALADTAPAPRVEVARSETREPLRVSSGVGAGMLLAPIRPVYPSIARAAGVQGVVVVAAVISREGRIERAHVVSGPPMLSSAALEAVELARYAPYRLNGVPTEVETTITVNFRMGG